MADISPSFVFRGLGESIYSILLSPGSSSNSGILWSGSNIGNVSSFSLVSKRKIKTWSPHNSSILSLYLNQSQECIISQEREGIVKEWNIETGITNIELQTGSLSFCRLALNNISLNGDNAQIIATSNQNKNSISLWDLNTKKETELTIDSNKFSCGMCMALSFQEINNVTYLASAFENGVIYYWDLKTMSIIHQIDSNWKEPILSLAVMGNEGLVGGAHKNLFKYKIENKNADSFNSNVTNSSEIPKEGINHLAIRNDNKICATAGWDYRIRIYSWKKLTPLAILKCHTNGVQQLAFSDTDNLLVAAGQDSNISLWNLY